MAKYRGISVQNADFFRVERHDEDKLLWVEEFGTADFEMARHFVQYRATPHEEWRIKRGGIVVLMKGKYKAFTTAR